MITVEQAWSIVEETVKPLPTVTISLSDAAGYVLATDVASDRDDPPTDRSAMDGYAVRAADLQGACVKLTVCCEIPAGSPANTAVTPGNCARIFTGGVVPAGADTVVMQEDTTYDPGRKEVTFLKEIKKGANVRLKGENAVKGEILIGKGAGLTPHRLAVCAGTGRSRVQVYQRPGVAVISTGRELATGDATVEPHQIHDSNGPMAAALMRENNFRVTRFSHAGDDPEQIADAIQAAFEESDVVALSGGVSVGDYDYVPEALRSLGFKTLFHGVIVKPGKPLLFALSPQGKLFWGLPGNPVSVLVGCHEFVLPCLRMMAGLKPEHSRPIMRLPLDQDVTVKSKRVEYLPARLLCKTTGGDGEGSRDKSAGMCISPLPYTGSGDLAAAGRADGSFIVPLDTRHIPAGTIVEFRPWRMFP